MHNRIEQVRRRCMEVFAVARAKYGVSLSNVQIRFDLRGRVAGMAGYKTSMGKRHYFLRFNVKMICSDSFKHIFNDTVPHEIAHLVCFENPQFGDNHNAGWKRVCRALGGNGERCHNEEVAYANGATYQYTTSNGKIVNLSQIRHRKIQKGMVYRFKYGWGHIDRNSKWVIVGSPAHRAQNTVQIAEKPTPAAPKVEGTTKADKVRSLIKLAKANGMDAEAVVTAVVAQLGMHKTQAARYVSENWERA